MNAIRSTVQREPAAVLTVLSWLAGAACALAGHPEFAPVLVAVGAAFLGLRTQVTPNATVATVKADVALAAATQVAANLSGDTAGAAGQITDAAAGLISATVASVTGAPPGKSNG